MKITEESFEKKQESAAEPVTVSERDKLRAMTGRDRVWYIWEYYKLPIFGVILGIFILYVVGTSFYRNSFDNAFHCVIVNNRSERELNALPLEQGFSKYLGLGAKETVTWESLFLSFGDDATELSYASMAKISALAASGDLDAMIGDRDTFEHYASLSACFDLEELAPAELIPVLTDRLLFAAGEDGISRPYGIDLSDTWFAKECGLAQTPPCLFFIGSSAHTEADIALLRYIFAPSE